MGASSSGQYTTTTTNGCGTITVWPSFDESPPVWSSSSYIIGNPYTNPGENTVQIKAKHWLVIQRGALVFKEVCDTEKEALSAAKRLAAQVGDEFFVFKAAKIVRPVPIEVEVEDA